LEVTTTTTDEQGQFYVTVAVSGTWIAHFNDALEQALTKRIAGKTSKAAQKLLLASGEVKQARIQLFPKGQTTLPTGIHAIKMIVTTHGSLILRAVLKNRTPKTPVFVRLSTNRHLLWQN